MFKRAGNRRGAGGIGCLLMVAIVAGGMYAGIELYLPQFRNSSFADRLTETFSYFGRQPEDAIRKRVIDTAKEFDIVLTPKQVKVAINVDNLAIDIDYEKVVDLRVWQKTLPFHIHRSGPY